MKSLNFVVLGDPSIAAGMGKKGTSTDLTIYDRKSSDTVATWTVPGTYPDKIQPLLQAINMAEYAIINATKLDRFLGEQILALDSAGLTRGFLMHSYEVDREKLKILVKNTVVSSYKIVDSVDQLKAEVALLEPVPIEGKTLIPVDHAFDVKGVGTVILGAVRSGKVKAYDNLALMPSGKAILVKSIQMHDDPVEEAASPARVGLAVKGASAEEISRGDVLCSPGSVTASTGPFEVAFEKSAFFKGDLAENHTYLVSVGLQVRTAKIKLHGSTLQLTTEKPIVFEQGQACVLLKPESTSTRIVGKGKFK